MAVEATEIFTPEAKRIAKIFGDVESFYQVPDYQRPYSWGDEQIDQLWDDILTALDSGDENYFLGPMILVSTPDGYLEVVDGQQRLTTLTILFCVIRDMYLGSLAPIDTTLANRINNAIKGIVEGKPRLKLITQLDHQNQFEQEVLNVVKFPASTLTKKQKEQNKFMNAAGFFQDKLSAMHNTKGIDGIKSFAEYVFKNVEMITITCSRRDYAIKLFQVLNTRGLDLTNADLIKSYLYGRLTDEIKRKQFIATWNQIETLAKQIDESLTDLLTYYEYYLLASNPKKSLFEELKAKLELRDPNEVIYDFQSFVVSFAEICKLKSRVIYSYWYLPNQVFWKSILTAAKMVNFADFDELCTTLRTMYYSYWIAGYTTSKIKQLSFNLIGWLKEGKTITTIKREIDQRATDDKIPIRLLADLGSEVYDESWLKPLLVLIEYMQTDESKIEFIELDRHLHVDHILPQKWQGNAYWTKVWDAEKADALLNTLGNLALLTGRKNISASNNDFSTKKSIYNGKGLDGKTAFVTTQIITENDDWTDKEMGFRFFWLIGQIEQLLGVKLDLNKL